MIETNTVFNVQQILIELTSLLMLDALAFRNHIQVLFCRTDDDLYRGAALVPRRCDHGLIASCYAALS